MSIVFQLDKNLNVVTLHVPALLVWEVNAKYICALIHHVISPESAMSKTIHENGANQLNVNYWVMTKVKGCLCTSQVMCISFEAFKNYNSELPDSFANTSLKKC